MLILLDECVPQRFRQHLPDHEVRTSPEMGWASHTNGDLLAAASVGFDVLVTTDQRLSYQQSLSRFDIAVIVLVARRNKLEALCRSFQRSCGFCPGSARVRFIAWASRLGARLGGADK